MPLREYVNFYIARATVTDGIGWLEGLKVSYGGLAPRSAALLNELRVGLRRSRHLEALARIQEVVGPLPDGDPLEALAVLFEQGALVRVTSAAEIAALDGEGEHPAYGERDLPADLLEGLTAEHPREAEPVTEPE